MYRWPYYDPLLDAPVTARGIRPGRRPRRDDWTTVLRRQLSRALIQLAYFVSPDRHIARHRRPAASHR